MLETAKYAISEAAKIVMSFYGKEKKTDHKSEVDLVTEVDIASEKKIVEIIKSKYPNHRFILEEGEDSFTDSEYVWVIDPIDGTTSFAHDYPMFSISIALFKSGKPYLGVVYVPYLNELFYAEENKGAYMNDKKIGVSIVDSLNKSLVATGFPYTRIKSDIDNLKNFSKIAKIAQGLRRSGSAAIDICYVACGRVDAYWELGLKIMDTAAAQVILIEAGGKVTDYQGKNIDKDFSKVVATNSVVHDQLLNVLEGDET